MNSGTDKCPFVSHQVVGTRPTICLPLPLVNHGSVHSYHIPYAACYLISCLDDVFSFITFMPCKLIFSYIPFISFWWVQSITTMTYCFEAILCQNLDNAEIHFDKSLRSNPPSLLCLHIDFQLTNIMLLLLIISMPLKIYFRIYSTHSL